MSNKKWCQHNLNDTIRFKLTKEGENHIQDLNSFGLAPIKFAIGEDGWTETRLWNFAKIFGSKLYMDCHPVVEMEIELKSCMEEEDGS